MNPEKRYYDFNTYLKNRYGCRVQKITIDAGMNCPNRDGTISRGGCIYCNAQGSGTDAHNRGLSITAQLEAGKQALGRRYKAKKFIAYFQSYTNTYAPVERLAAMYTEAMAVPGIVGLSVGTRPDCVTPEIIDLLASYTDANLVWIEYGLQSAHDATLEKINRGHDFSAFQKAVEITANREINICTHVILGLPGETRKHMIETAEKIATTGIDGIKLHLLYVIKNTTLAGWYAEGRYKCLEKDEYVDIVCEFLSRLPANIVIQRLTGDPHPRELLAPKWALEKSETLRLIDQKMEEKHVRQGSSVSMTSLKAPF